MFISNDQSHLSKAQFGDYSSEYIKNGDPNLGYGIHWYMNEGKVNWKIEIEAAIYGSSSYMSKEEMHAIIDTGTSLIAIPSPDF